MRRRRLTCLLKFLFWAALTIAGFAGLFVLPALILQGLDGFATFGAAWMAFDTLTEMESL